MHCILWLGSNLPSKLAEGRASLKTGVLRHQLEEQEEYTRREQIPVTGTTSYQSLQSAVTGPHTC